eukprot:CAMPEP_0115103862 /NCGR_PEP_ID=MMETSP0227-20121206/34889_1 /TAXON_ID=89957 /ORGANISM="Polarella glacialis, Strain CCMP 1383" /LENGTH=143 /DNA_ID=CAMNT_0002500503 /DNA_START=670 /DNA_END=1098 /DNA_ORIENTATION=-
MPSRSSFLKSSLSSTVKTSESPPAKSLILDSKFQTGVRQSSMTGVVIFPPGLPLISQMQKGSDLSAWGSNRLKSQLGKPLALIITTLSVELEEDATRRIAILSPAIARLVTDLLKLCVCANVGRLLSRDGSPHEQEGGQCDAG